MGKRNYRRRLVIRVLIILVSALLVILLSYPLGRIVEESWLHPYADGLLSVFFVSTILILAVNAIYAAREKKRDALDREDLARLKERASTDSLTGLYNREAAVEQINDYLDSGAGKTKRHALMLIDFDNFKDINDTFGHFEGDKVLQAMAEKIRAVFRTGDIVGRLGGDEFIILMKEAASRSDVHRKALELQNALEHLAAGEDVDVTVTASIGIAYTEDEGTVNSFEQLYRQADEALYKAKLTGKNRYCFLNEKAPDSMEQARNALSVNSAGIELKALIDNIDGGIALLEIGEEIRSIYLSRSYIRMMHITYEGIKQANNRVLAFIHHEDMASVEDMLRRGADTCLPVEAVFRRPAASGGAKWCHMRAVRIAYDYSEAPVLVAIVTDVTNLKETELKYEAQKKQLETVLRVSHVVTFEVDIHYRTLHITEPTVTKYGLDTYVIGDMPESLIESGAIHPDSVEECRRMYDEIYAGVPGSAIIHTLRRSGSYTIERFTYFPVRDNSGQPVKAVGIAEEMETYGNKTLRVAQLEKQYRGFSESLMAVMKVCLSKDTYEFLKVDPAFLSADTKYPTYTALFEASIKPVVREEDQEIIQREFGLEGLRKAYLEKKQIVGLEFNVFDEDRIPRRYSINAASYENELDGEVYAFIRFRDVTYRQKLEEEYGIPLNRLGERGGFYEHETLRRMGNAMLSAKKPFAVAVLAVTNYGSLLETYGRLLMNDLLFGFVGKAMMIFRSGHLVQFDNTGRITVLFTDMASSEPAAAFINTILKHLKNPAFFQFREEEYMEYRYGIAVSKPETSDFDFL